MHLPELLAKHKIISVIVAVIVLLGGYYLYSKHKASSGSVRYVTEAASNQTVTVAVTGTGQVAAEKQLNIKPQSSNQATAQVTSVLVKNGDSVHAGQTLITLDTRTAANSVAQAKASLAQAQANYDKVLAGATSTDLALAQLALDNAKRSQQETAQQQATSVKNALSSMLNNGLAAVPGPNNSSTASPTLSGTYNATTQGQYRISVSSAFNTATGTNFKYEGLEGGTAQASTGGPVALGTHGLYIQFPSSGIQYNSSDYWTIDIPNTKASGYLSAQNSYNTALQNQTNAIADSQSAVDNAQLQLQQKTAPALPSDIAAAQAQVQNAQAALQTAETNYSNNIITAPFDGVVTGITVQKGDQAGSSAIAVLVTKQQIAQISLNEVDVAKVKIGQKVTLTFDAIDGLSISGTVGEIDTIGTVSQGVVTYNVKIAFDSQDDRIKPGMSVSASVITNVAADVLTVPNSAIKTDSNGSYVQILDASGKPQNKTVETGISSDTLTQITSGLTSGDMVVTQTINTTTKTTTTGATNSGLRIPGLGGGNATFGGGGAVRVGGGAAGRGN